MKRKSILLVCSALIVAFTGFALLLGKTSSFRKAKPGNTVSGHFEAEDGTSGEKSTLFDDSDSATVSLETVGNEKRSTSSNSANQSNEKQKTAKAVSVVQKTVTSQTVSTSPSEPPEPTKTITANGKTYTVPFRETMQTSEKNDRYCNCYYTDGHTVDLEYDCITGDLVYAYFTQEEPVGQTISKEQVRTIVEPFLREHCNDFSKYTFDGCNIVGGENYFFYYSVHVDGTESSRTITVTTTFDGHLLLFSNKKFNYETIDQNMEIDREKLDEKLREKVRSIAGDSASFTIISAVVDKDESGNPAMKYIYKFDGDDSNAVYLLYIPIP